MTPAIDFRLYLVTNRRLCTPRALTDVVRDACAAGVRAVQLRERDLDRATVAALADNLLAVTARENATLFVNQSHPVAGSATGLHFPESMAITRPGEPVLLGASTHSRERAIAAAGAGADFVTFGPVYETPAKTKYGPPQGLEKLRDVSSAVDIPVFAIGGITPGRVRPCLDAGARGVAVMGAIMSAPDVAAAVRDFAEELGGL